MKALTMAPATLARRALERTVTRSERRAYLIDRLRARAMVDPDGPWSGLLAKLLAQQG